LLLEPRILDQPDMPTIVDVRWTGRKHDTSLTIKEIEKRTRRRFIGEKQVSRDTISREYQQIQERAVNLARLHRNGWLEIRIASLSTTSNYAHELRVVRERFKSFFPLEDFEEVSLTKARTKLWE